jgi:Mitochondrial distribution and morphology protein 10
MDYVVYAFGNAAGWNRDNSYSALTATSDGIYCVSSALGARVDLALQHCCLFPLQRTSPLTFLRSLLPISQRLIHFLHWV